MKEIDVFDVVRVDKESNGVVLTDKYTASYDRTMQIYATLCGTVNMTRDAKSRMICTRDGDVTIMVRTALQEFMITPKHAYEISNDRGFSRII